MVWAANHNPRAVQLHARAYPSASHVCQDLHQARWDRVPAAEVVWASPACQGHSQAATRGLEGGRRGTHRKADEQRSTAWAVIAATEALGPLAVVVENVEDFRRWPLYQVWLSAFRALGYETQERVIDSADLGVPQHRRRL